ncbi:MAG: formate dehydrogenase accessory sulfurtransferase FdhD [Terriglobia bacterium]|jgi:FdhD protein
MERGSQALNYSTVFEWSDKKVRRVRDALAGEEPLQIQLGRQRLSVTMRTPGNDFELAVGLLFTEGIIQSAKDLANPQDSNGSRSDQNVMKIELKNPRTINSKRIKRNFLANSSCGLCGKAYIEECRLQGIKRPNARFRIDPEVLCSLPETLRASQVLFGRTGGLHAAALFEPSGKLITVREDVGRHNAVDKLIGWALLEGRIPASDCALLASGRGGFEIIQKSLLAGIPLLASVSAASSLAVQLARECGLTLVGFLRGRRFVCYCGEERLGLGTSPK